MAAQISEAHLMEKLKSFESDVDYVNENYFKLRETFENKFVAIRNCKVVGSDRNYERLLEGLEKKKIETRDVLIRFIFEKNYCLVF